MNMFRTDYEKTVNLAERNFFGINNYDEFRFGKYPYNDSVFSTFVHSLKQTIKRVTGYKKTERENEYNTFIKKYGDSLQKLYSNLNSYDKQLYVDLIAYRNMSFRNIKLSRNNADYWKAIETAKTLSDPKDTYDPHFMHFMLEKFDLKPVGYDVKLYFSTIGIAIDYIIEQYAYKQNNKKVVCVEKGDVVLDIGACWGDTALYFAHQSGETGKVYSFEFIPGNIKLFNINTSLNPDLAKRIEIVPHPVSNKTGDKIYFKDSGPGSRIEFSPFADQTGETTTVTVDDLVKDKGLTKVDFIKMDIEGAETFALQGAIETIKKFRPKLAIAIYHSMDEMISIPNWILDLNLDYEIFIGHYTIHKEETICFARPRNKA